jgi:SAM-dependent methyltransferase
MYDFFIEQNKKIDGVNSYLEIGPGHGLYLCEALKRFPSAEFTAIDISPISAEIASSIVNYFVPGSRCSFIIQDFRFFGKDRRRFDYVVMCEVIEHVDRPLEILQHAHDLLRSGGHLFITTCCNCPAIDHVYLYECIDEIRAQLKSAGFVIVRDLPLPVNDIHMTCWHNKKVEANYAALLRKGV